MPTSGRNAPNNLMGTMGDQVPGNDPKQFYNIIYMYIYYYLYNSLGQRLQTTLWAPMGTNYRARRSRPDDEDDGVRLQTKQGILCMHKT